MDNKGILYNMGGWSQFFFIFFLFFSGLMMASFIIVLIMPMDELLESARAMRLAQVIQAVFMFLIPALAYAFLYQGNVKSYLNTDKHINIRLLLCSVLLIISIQPLINCIGYYNQQIILPESLNWMKEYEESAEKSLKLLFSNRSIPSLIFNLLVIAVMAGLAEEFFFRGCLQQIMQKIVKNQHFAIWITAIIFSAIHFQFYGFVPRVLLGALLGYLFVWSGSIWVPVIVHTIHNAINVVLIHIYYDTPQANQIEDFRFEENTLLVSVSFALSAIIIFMIYRRVINKQKSEN
ncbi:CPBP family intramembrane glutamic endopeptidase [Dysgonomonas termitidis]|uniref:CPBP family intramembrane glutamic endopeptidase n=1 Tax=Dysgonomonas termitidis TaxID=1516126 RepID=A0ABV9KW17_9BACT